MARSTAPHETARPGARPHLRYPMAAAREARTALGRALETRAEEVAAMAAARAFPGVEVDAREFSTSALATRLIGRYLATGQIASAAEHEDLADNGEMPLTGGSDLGDLTKSYLAWRDSICAVIREESERIGADQALVDEALNVARISCDSSLVRMARRFDETRKQLESQVQEERARTTETALYDKATGLPNRTRFLELLASTLDDKAEGEGCCVLFVDLDHFKVVNDHFGHTVGDQLLVAVSRRLSRAARRTDVVSRFGGNEFVVLARGLSDPEAEGRAVAERIRTALERPFRLAGRLVMVSASIGISPVGGEMPDDLVSRADQAMHEAKREGRNRVVMYDPDLGRAMSYRSRLTQDLPFAIRQGELDVLFQPICTPDRRPSGAEALVRWTHPSLGPIPPSRFIPIAEETGLVGAIGEWVLRRAVTECQKWRLAGAQHATVSVNVSAHQLDASYAELVHEVLCDTGLPAQALRLELTESALLPDAPGCDETLGRLGELGVGLEIDDFGTGYSSLAYLRRLPVQSLKIDRSFVSGLGDEGADWAIVLAMIELAHQLGLSVIAEGVETEAELSALLGMGCDRFQGYLLGRPAPAADLAWTS